MRSRAIRGLSLLALTLFTVAGLLQPGVTLSGGVALVGLAVSIVVAALLFIDLFIDIFED